jgi:hypothetical protein
MASKLSAKLDTNIDRYVLVKCKQLDDIELKLDIFENGVAKLLNFNKMVVQGLKADNTFIIQSTGISASGNTMTIKLIRDFTRVAGNTMVEVVLTDSNSMQNTTFNLCLNVTASVVNKALESQNTITVLEELKDLLEAIEAENVQAGTNIASLKTENGKAETNISGLKAENTKATPNITNLGSENTKATSNINTLKTENTTATTNTNNLKTENINSVTNKNNLKAENDKAAPNITNLGAENIKATPNIASLKAENDKAPNNITTLKTQNDRADILIPELKTATTKGETVRDGLNDLINSGGAMKQASPRNLLIGERWYYSPTTNITKTAISKYNIKFTLGSTTTACTWIGGSALKVNVKKDDYLTFLAWIKSTVPFEFRISSKGGTSGVTAVNKVIQPTGGEFILCKVTTKALIDNPEVLLYVFDTRNTNGINGDIEIKEWALYNSSNEMDWTPAPEEADSLFCGNRNLLIGDPWQLSSTPLNVLSKTTIMPNRHIKFTWDNAIAWSNNGGGIGIWAVPKDPLIYTCLIKTNTKVRLRIQSPNGTIKTVYKDVESSDKWQRVFLESEVTNENPTIAVYCFDTRITDNPIANSGNVEIKDWMLSIGNIKNVWTPPPEDTKFDGGRVANDIWVKKPSGQPVIGGIIDVDGAEASVYMTTSAPDGVTPRFYLIGNHPKTNAPYGIKFMKETTTRGVLTPYFSGASGIKTMDLGNVAEPWSNIFVGNYQHDSATGWNRLTNGRISMNGEVEVTVTESYEVFYKEINLPFAVNKILFMNANVKAYNESGIPKGTGRIGVNAVFNTLSKIWIVGEINTAVEGSRTFTVCWNVEAI